ncbi:flavin reductase family protein [Burkholderia sp. BCC1977]|uniref:flavin reductase family protein n=1 Tax=Burkholderia sp. BCC1977 TaxID=2817440 RepID=UPI002ABD8FF3|nr:flavin reductase family protein [Burkholderia sp. BCC1977]
MHYTPLLQDHNLPHDPMLALVVPRPIGWISTVNSDGIVNLAPYSFFNLLSGRPPYVMFSSNGYKDSQRNAEATGEFVCNVATYDLREAVDLSSAPLEPHFSEPTLLGLEMAPSVKVQVPRVARSPGALECRYLQTVELPGLNGKPNASMVIGEVISVYVDDDVLVNGMVDLHRVRPITRLGYLDYGALGEIWSSPRPDAEMLVARAAALGTKDAAK